MYLEEQLSIQHRLNKKLEEDKKLKLKHSKEAIERLNSKNINKKEK